MNKLIVIALCSSLGLAGCATKTDPVTGTTTEVIDPQVLATIEQIRTGIQTTCGFSATIGSILAIVGTFVPGVSIVPGVINAVCSAVTAKSVTRNGARPQVNGVTVEGRFVR